jgi:hypothetical protein
MPLLFDATKVVDVNFYDWRGRKVPDWSWHNMTYGLRMDFKSPLYTDSIKTGRQ